MRSALTMFGIFMRDLYRSRVLIREMVKNDFRNKYASSALGVVWAFIQPLVQIAVLWFVFSVGFRSQPTSNGVPFSLWLVCGLVPWNFLSDAIMSGTNSLMEYSYLVKKVVFRTSILPIVKIMSAFIVHIAFLVFLFIMSFAYGYHPTLRILQLLYYIPCAILLCLGLTWMTSALAAFFKDIAQFVGIILQLLVWLTPVLWNAEDMLSPRLRSVFKFNPAYYIVQGYRDSFTGSFWFWDKPVWTAYYLAVTFGLLFGGALIFHRTRRHFSDVL